MARDPGSTWKPLPEAGAPDGHVKTQLIVHSTGTKASAAANWRYFAQEGVQVESTFIVGLTPADPTLQAMDSTDVADANMSASKRAISIEVVGDGAGPFTDWQLAELIRIGRWAVSTHPIARRVIPAESESGLGWHVMFGAPGPWTTVRGKVCPGAARVEQLKTIVFPAICGAKEDDMAAADVWTTPTGKAKVHAGDRLEGVDDKTGRIEAKVDRLLVGGIDYERLANLVADKLATRLAN